MGFLSHLLHVLENIVFLRLTVGELRSDRDPKLFYLQVLKLWMCGLSYWDVKVVAGGFSNCAIKHHLLEAKPHFAQLLPSLLLYYNKSPFYWPNIYHTHTIGYQWTCAMELNCSIKRQNQNQSMFQKKRTLRIWVLSSHVLYNAAGCQITNAFIFEFHVCFFTPVHHLPTLFAGEWFIISEMIYDYQTWWIHLQRWIQSHHQFLKPGLTFAMMNKSKHITIFLQKRSFQCTR